MSMDGIALGAVIAELQPLIGGKIDKVQQRRKTCCSLLYAQVPARSACSFPRTRKTDASR
jgi:predicted ribosome quality control (RQC) complex YloA/Tae2 family protein